MQSEKKITLYCLPFAGGNAFVYRDLQQYLPSFIVLEALELPGRGKKINQPLITQIDCLVDGVFMEIADDLNKQPFAIFGHSLGALLGYLLTQRINQAGSVLPLNLFCSGRQAPSIRQRTRLKHRLPKRQFREYLNHLGGIPKEVWEHEELLEFFEPIIRADFQAIETYEYSSMLPVDIPITILYGQNDPEMSYQDLMPWQQETKRPLTIEVFTGGHFFIYDHLAKIARLLSTTLNV